MAHRPIVLIHGYSDNDLPFNVWINKLGIRGIDLSVFHIYSCEFNRKQESIQNIAEEFDRALREQVGLNEDGEFDAIVHSSGMLVIRSWLTTNAKRRSLLKHVIGLAPANFGSPFAHKGRSRLSASFMGLKKGSLPDFLEAGNRILNELELGSRFSWDLTEIDLLGEQTFYGPNNDTPYAFTFCGTDSYLGFNSSLREPGTDGVVRLAGCAMSIRKIIMNWTDDTGEDGIINLSDWSNVDIPLIPVKGADHTSILRNPPDELVDMVYRALEVDSDLAMMNWYDDAFRRTWKFLVDLPKWQQFVIRAVDEQGNPVTDYFVELKGVRVNGTIDELPDFHLNVHAYSGDPSMRNFHVNLSRLKPETLKRLSLHVIASFGLPLSANHSSDNTDPNDNAGLRHAALDLTDLLRNIKVNMFFPFTTTLIELRLNRNQH